MYCTCSAQSASGKATVWLTAQEELVAGRYMRAPADASLADKGRAKGKKATKRAGATALQGFRKYFSPSNIQVSISCTAFASSQAGPRGISAADTLVIFQLRPMKHEEQMHI